MLSMTNYAKNTEKRVINVVFTSLKKQAHALFQQAAWITEITNAEEYTMALALMDDLMADYTFNRGLITVLSASIARWEDENEAFEEFNAAIDQLDPGVSVLRLLMDQHHLGVADFPELGSKSLISRILNRERRLTAKHIQALCQRFELDPSLFFANPAKKRQPSPK